MGYDRGGSFPFDFEPNGIPFGSNRKENCHHDLISFNVKGNIVFSLYYKRKKKPAKKTASEMSRLIMSPPTKKINKKRKINIKKINKRQ